MTAYQVRVDTVPAPVGALTSYEVKPGPVPAGTGGLTTAEIVTILARLDPAALQDAGAAQTQLGRELATMAAHLAQEAATLAQNWSGVAARTALARLQRLHQQTATLATQVSRTGAVLTWLGTQVLPAFQHPATPTQARQFLTHLTTALSQADKSLPTLIGSTTSEGTTSPGGTSTPRGTTSHSISQVLRRPDHTSTISTTHHTRTTGHSGQGSPTGTPLHIWRHTPRGPDQQPAECHPRLERRLYRRDHRHPGAQSGPESHFRVGPGRPDQHSSRPGTATVVGDETATATPVASEAISDADLQSPPASPRTRSPHEPHQLRQPRQPEATPPIPMAPATTIKPSRLPRPCPAPTPPPPARSPASRLPRPPARPKSAPAAQPPRPACYPELPTLDSDLSGGALPLPAQPVITPTAMSAPAPAPHSFLPPPAGVVTPPTQQRHRESWPTDDPNPWALPTDCVPPLIEGP